MLDRLFVYGTLHPDRAPAGIADVVRRFRDVGRGSVRGRRFELGAWPDAYPGVVLDAQGGAVEGMVFEVPEGVFGKLDAYEGFEFERVRVAVTMADGSECECWMYVWLGAG